MHLALFLDEVTMLFTLVLVLTGVGAPCGLNASPNLAFGAIGAATPMACDPHVSTQNPNEFQAIRNSLGFFHFA